MKFRKLDESVELPEKKRVGHYINVRSGVRIDVRPGEEVAVATGVDVTVSKSETALFSGTVVGVISDTVASGELFITVLNQGDRNIIIYPGMVLGEIKVSTAAKATKVKTARIKHPVRVIA